jgi:hypothetical protein
MAKCKVILFFICALINNTGVEIMPLSADITFYVATSDKFTPSKKALKAYSYTNMDIKLNELTLIMCFNDMLHAL